MNITQTFYDALASDYDKLFSDWQAATREQAILLDTIFKEYGFDASARILDCACGIGTQSVGLAALGYKVCASDLSAGALAQARERAKKNNLNVSFVQADFCALSRTFSDTFDIVIAMDNALPHMLSEEALASAIKSITGQIAKDGLFVASIRDYDALLLEKPPYSPPYIHKNEAGQKVSFQTWDWKGDHYTLCQYIIDDEKSLRVSKFVCEYRATRREEITKHLLANGCKKVEWLMPQQTGFYQPIVVATK